ncbi:hypothetical protein QC763_609980 [Podospora pseudopauciseta]|uniref:Uncharacterized protein n=1 Tax=Podospora pseudopauciseta TaxID=2093780 RepID=A0ABR0H6V7_9PEZI|nr:hypothetical protein QC763_609980 [Podospora pseudopauciseta]
MCDFIQRRHFCGHFRFIASKWCRDYSATQHPINPNILYFERVDALCRDCKLKEAPPCDRESMIKRKQNGNLSSL